MRLIKFRAYDKVLKRFLTQEETDCYSLESLNINGTIEFTQYTGIKDKKDKEIYEGDRLLAYGERWKVFFSEGCFIAHRAGKMKALRTMECEVIGNVYELH